MPNLSLSHEIATLRKQGGYFNAQEYGLIEICGKDAAKFLQAQTTNDVFALKQGSGQLSCLLDRKAHVQAFFHLFKRHDSFLIIVEREQIATILGRLEQYKFNEEVDFVDLSESGAFLAIQGPMVMGVMESADPEGFRRTDFRHQSIVEAKLCASPTYVFRKSVTGEFGYFIWVLKAQLNKLLPKLKGICLSLGFVEMSLAALEVARIEAGQLKYGVDFSCANLLPELGMDELVASYTKGCFVGQEVLARVKSHGAPARALAGLSFSPDDYREELPLDGRLIDDGEEIARIKSNGFSPTLQARIAFAFIKRDYRVPDKLITGKLDGVPVHAVVVMLPFYSAESIQARAMRLYEEATGLFPTESDSEVESRSVSLLRQCLDLDPGLEDAYEVLGVILSKRNRLEEAVDLMKKLSEINPESVMAHTNLSVFYMQQGLKEAAEEEKAVSMSIRMRLAAKEANLVKQVQEEKQLHAQETLERLEMFRQVLAIDKDDQLANYGLGSCLVELKQFDEAVTYLSKATTINPMHAVAYSALAAAQEAIGHIDSAIETLKKGIEIASKRGDMMPLRQMQERLAVLIAADVSS